MWRLMVCHGLRTAANAMVSAAAITVIANRFAWIGATVQRRIGEIAIVWLDEDQELRQRNNRNAVRSARGGDQ